MATRPSSLPPWATDATFTSGTKSGQATKLAPTTLDTQQGLVSGSPFPAQKVNYNLANHRDWLEYLDSRGKVSFATKNFTGGGATYNDVAFTQDELDADTIVLSTTSGSATVTGFVMPASPTHKAGPKLLVITSSFTFRHADVGSATGYRLKVTGATNWSSVAGDFAILYWASNSWVLHPLLPPGVGGGGTTELSTSDTPTGTVDNYSPGSWQDTTHLMLTISGTATFKGFAAPGVGKPRVRRITAVTGTAVIEHMTSATSANRVVCAQSNPTFALNGIIVAGETAFIVYSDTDSRWYLIAGVKPERYNFATVAIGGTMNACNLGAGYGASEIVFSAGAANPVLNGFASPPVNVFVRGGVKLMTFTTSGIINHLSGSAAAGDKIALTTGAGWDFAPGDYALLSYSSNSSIWIVHPLKSAAGLEPVNVSGETLTSDVSENGVWVGGPSPDFGFSTTNFRVGVVKSIFFPAGSITDVGFDNAIDPTGALALAFDSSLDAYALTWVAIAPRSVIAQFVKVVDLS